MSALKYVAIALLLALPSKCKMSSYVPWSPIQSAAMSTTITSPNAAGEWECIARTRAERAAASGDHQAGRGLADLHERATAFWDRSGGRLSGGGAGIGDGSARRSNAPIASWPSGPA